MSGQIKISFIAENQATGEVAKFGASLGAAGKEAQEAGAKVAGLSKDLDMVKANAKIIQADVKALEGDLIRNKQAFGAESDEVKKTSSALNEARASFKSAQSSISGVESDLIKAKSAAKEAASGFSEVGNNAAKSGKEIEKAGSSTKELGGGMSKLKSGLGEVSSELGGGVSKLADFAKGAAGAAAAVALVVEGLKKSIEIASEFQSGQAKMQAQLGLTGDEAKKLGAVSEAVFKTGFGENITEVNAELTGLKQSFKNLSDTDLENLTRQGLILKQTFGVETQEQVKVLSSVTKNFGIDGSTALDLVTASFQKGGNQADDLLDTLNEYSPQFAKAGFTAQEFAGILVTGLQNGAFNADKVADSIKEFTIRIQDGSTTTAAGLQAIGLNQAELAAKIGNGSLTIAQAQGLVNEKLRAVKDTVQQNIAGVALYGTQWEDVGPKVILSLDQGKGALGDFKGSTDAAGKSLEETFDFQLKKLGNNVQAAAAKLGGAFLPALTKMAESLTPIIEGFSEKLAPVIEKIEPLITKAGQAFTDYLGPFAAGALQGIQNALDQIMPAIDQLEKAFSDAGITAAGLGQVMGGVVGTSFTIVGAAAGTLINGVTSVIEIFNFLKQKVEEALGPLKGVGDILGGIGNALGVAKPQIDNAKTSIDGLGTSAAQTGQAMKDAGTGSSDWGNATAAASQKAATALPSVTQFNNAVTQGGQSAQQAAATAQALGDAVTKAGTNTTQAAASFTAAQPSIDAIKAATEAVGVTVKDAAIGTSDWGAATTAASTAVTAATPAIGAAAAPLNQLTSATNATKTALGTMPAAASAAGTGVSSAITTGMGQATTAATTGSQDIATSLKDGLGGAAKEAKKNIDDLVKVTEDGFKSLGTTLEKLNDKLLTGLSDAISKSTDQIKQSLTGVEKAVSDSGDKISNELGKLKDDAARQSKEMSDAITSNSKAGFEGIGKILEEIRDLLKSFANGAKDTGLQFGQNLASGIEAGKSQVVAAAQGVASAASNAMASGDFLGAITGGGRGATPPATAPTPGGKAPGGAPPTGNVPGRDSGLSGIGKEASSGLGSGKTPTGAGASIGGGLGSSRGFAGEGTEEERKRQEYRRGNRQSAGGGYADGLENVPSQGYYLLHPGESVLPSGLSQLFRQNVQGAATGGGGQGRPTYTTVIVQLDKQEIGRIMVNENGQQVKQQLGVGLMQ